MVAFVRKGTEHGEATIKVGAEGPILWATGDFLRELQDGAGGWDLGDHEIEEPTETGLLCFEGFIEVGFGEDPDVEWRGAWRRLNHWEMLRMRFGKTPWGNDEVNHAGA